MTDAAFAPVLYLKEKCPFCLKVRLFLLEAGLLGQVKVKEFAPGTDEEQSIKAEVGPHLEKVSFPAAQVAPGQYMNDSDAIIAHFADKAKVDPAHMPVLSAYVGGAFKQIMDLYKENMELKKQLA